MPNLESEQWKNAQATSLWKRTLGSNKKEVKNLRESFLKARENAAILLDKIRYDFPKLTIHDITHVDSLWNVADTIIGKDYPINPLEGYILGIAFLIHDAALSYDAVGGKEALRATTEWKDAHAYKDNNLNDEDFEKECDFVTIRVLHARNAETILKKEFRHDNGTTFYIIDNNEYRNKFGKLIGEIAASHHWNIDDVESRLKKQINPMSGMPKEWIINAQKLACILRCADAGHIDDGRAPDSIYRYLVINGVSQQHWKSQNHLCQVCEDCDDETKLCITSSNPFGKEDFAAWNVAYDAVRQFDEELKKSNNLLKSAKLSFPHSGVSGAESKEVLSKYIETEGWQPCSIGVHASNIKSLIESLGGSNLYGEYNLLLVALRELIQNARDAIYARSSMDNKFRNGAIIVRYKEDAGKRLIEVEDNGIGMSLNCINNNLLDFGNSYWKSNLAMEENPGLRSKGFQSIGKFGIGFYSVFMVAKSVEVVTKRYDKGVNDANKIEFPIGLTLSPILSKATLSSSLSTIVKFELKADIDLQFHSIRINLKKAIQILVAGLDTDVYYEENSDAQKVHTNIKSTSFDKKKWLEDLVIKCPDNIEILASKLEELIDENGESRGLILPPEEILLYPSDYVFPCIKTINGLQTSLSYDKLHIQDCYIGYIDGKENNISRNEMVLDAPLKKCLQQWTRGKYNNKYKDIIANKDLAYKYSKLIGLCKLDEDIVYDNTIRIYKTMRNKYNSGSIKDLCNIHMYLYTGVYYYAGRINLPGDDFHAEEILKEHINSQTEEFDTFEKFRKSEFIHNKSKKKLEDLKIISIMPTSKYDEVIQKYCIIYIFELLRDKNHQALKIWLNLILDKVDGKMIDWEKLDENRLEESIRYDLYTNDRMYHNTCTHLEQFLIPSDNYLKEIGVLTYKNS